MSILRFVPRRRPGPAGEYQKSTSIIYRPDAFFKKSLIFFRKNLHFPLYKSRISGIIIIVRCASVAQSVEQGTENPRVIGSIPIGGTTFQKNRDLFFRICGRSSSGRAPPCQGGGSEFEPRRPLQMEWKHSLQYGDVAKW